MEYKDAKIFMLSTNNEANIGDFIIYKYNQDCYIDGENLKDKLVCGVKKCDGNIDTTNQHLYFTSDEDIKDNFKGFAIVTVRDDTRIHYLVEVIVTEKNQCYCKGDRKFSFKYYSVKPIIAATDTSLKIHEFDKGVFKDLEYSLPQPSQQFIEQWIEEYNKGNTIIDIKVQYETRNISDYRGFFNFQKILKVNPDNTINIKLPQPIIYTKEEVIKLIHSICSEMYKRGIIYSPTSVDNWLKENL